MLATEKRWTELCLKLGAKNNLKTGRTIKSTHSEVVLTYAQPGRFYHNLDHINSGLASLDEIRRLATDEDVLEMAWWWHDFVYRSGYQFNEFESGALAFKALIELNVRPEICLNIVRRIIPTLHNYIPPDYDDWLMVDIDLAQLGAPPDIFDENRDNIRKEFPQVSDVDFARGTADRVFD